jgi:ABC-type sugar transport system permease subunit
VTGRGRLREALTAYAMLAPSLAVFGVFFFYALYRLIYLGLHQSNRTGTAERWVGLEQFGDVLGGEQFRSGLWISIQYAFWTVPAGLILGVLLAVAAHRQLRGIRFFQTVFSSTVATSVAVASVVFFVMLNGVSGYLRPGQTIELPLLLELAVRLGLAVGLGFTTLHFLRKRSDIDEATSPNSSSGRLLAAAVVIGSSVVFFVLLGPSVGRFGGAISSLADSISLATPQTAIRGVALSSVWQNLGLTFIIVLAGLQAIPDELLEAATVDGYGPVRRFFKVTLPLLSPTMLFLVVVLTIFALQAFAQIDILTQGGPAGSTETLVFKIFRLGEEPVNVGRGAVMGVGLFVVTLVVALGQFTLLNRRVHYGDR